MKPLPHIVVMERGFVLVGRLRPDPDDFLFLIVDDCCVVRRWGTAAGLGQLAREGPLTETILDPEGSNVRIGKRGIYRLIPCSERWKTWTPPSMPG